MLQTIVRQQPIPNESRLDLISEQELNARVAQADAYVAREEDKMQAAQATDASDKEAFAQAERDWDAAQAAFATAQQAYRAGEKPLNNAASNLTSARRARALLSEELRRREQQRRQSQGLDR